MESAKADGEDNKELDDSGYVQDESTQKSSPESGSTINLLDLSDDVLLCIFRYCRANELKALGFTCTRLAPLVCDRSLWQWADASDLPCGRKRLRWLLDHGLHAGTTHLHLKGFADSCMGCQGYINGVRKEVEEKFGDLKDRPCSARRHRDWMADPQNPLPRTSSSPSWPDEDPPRVEVTDPEVPVSCPGPHFTLTPCLLRRLIQQCNITHLQANSCNINCSKTPLSLFPSTLTHLSLRGTRCFNVPNMEKSFLFQIQDHLPNLESLDLSECAWLEPTCLLPLSKLPRLQKLYMVNCPRMTEFVAYASLAGRYGFKKLELFDLRGSPIGDSEAAALGWLPSLQELYLSSQPAPAPPGPAPPGPAPRAPHQHFKDDVLPVLQELACWEMDEPEYFKKLLRQKRKRSKADKDGTCFHNVPYHKCMDGYCEDRNSQSLKRKTSSDEPGPSKRRKSSSSTSESEDDDIEMRDDELNDDTKLREKVVSERNEDSGEGTSGTANNDANADVDNVAAENNERNVHIRGANAIIAVVNYRDGVNDIGGENDGNDLVNDNGAGNDRNGNVNNGEANEGEQGNEGERRNERHEFVYQVNIGQLIHYSQQRTHRRRRVNVIANNGQQIDGGQPNNGEEVNIEVQNNEAHQMVLEGNPAQNNDQQNNAEQPINEQAEAADRAPVEDNEQPNNAEQLNNGEGNQAQENRDGAAQNRNVEARPRAQVLYINLGRQNHPIFRAVFPGPDIPGPLSMEIRMPASHMPTTLISDVALRSFGHSDDDNYYHIGGPPNPQNARPSKSNLRILSVQGYKKITDRSLAHLRTAAPKLEVIDFSETSVTEKGVEWFMRMRPEVKVYHSQFVDRDGPLDCRVTVDG